MSAAGRRTFDPVAAASIAGIEAANRTFEGVMSQTNAPDLPGRQQVSQASTQTISSVAQLSPAQVLATGQGPQLPGMQGAGLPDPNQFLPGAGAAVQLPDPNQFLPGAGGAGQLPNPNQFLPGAGGAGQVPSPDQFPPKNGNTTRQKRNKSSNSSSSNSGSSTAGARSARASRDRSR